jgi:hypothetical protein
VLLRLKTGLPGGQALKEAEKRGLRRLGGAGRGWHGMKGAAKR